MRRPKALCPGDRIGVVAPASPFDRPTFERGLAELTSLGFEPVFDETVFARRNYVAGSTAVRAAALEAVWRDPSIAGVMAARGGYGSAQVLPFLSAMSDAAPKVFIGCSDLTALLTHLAIERRVVCFHGPMVITLGRGADAYDRRTLLESVTRDEPLGELRPDGLETIRPGEARGPLLGGTLTQIVSSLGTPFAFDPPAGHVLLLDDVDERPYRLDRMLTQARQAGLFARASAVVCNGFPGCVEPGTEPLLDARHVIRDALTDFPGPVLFGFPTGHTAGQPMWTLPLGIETVVMAGPSPRLVIEEAAVE